MSVSILEALENAEFNLNSNLSFQRDLGKKQLHNAIILLDKGYDAMEEVEPLLDKYGKVENVPEKEDN